jgi:hypothetical protein
LAFFGQTSNIKKLKKIKQQFFERRFILSLPYNYCSNMKKAILYSAVIGLLTLQSSCEIQKRKHTPGYHFSFHKNTKSKLEKEEILTIKHDNSITLTGDVQASTEDTYIVVSSNQGFDNPKWEVKTVEPSDSCDEVILSTGEIIAAKVIEISISEIKYKHCGNLAGPTIVKRIDEVFMVRYSNGDKDVFETKTEEKASTSSDLMTRTEYFEKQSKVMLVSTASFTFSTILLGLLMISIKYTLYLFGTLAALTGLLGIIYSWINISRSNRIIRENRGKNEEKVKLAKRQRALTVFYLLLSILFVAGSIFYMIIA